MYLMYLLKEISSCTINYINDVDAGANANADADISNNLSGFWEPIQSLLEDYYDPM